MTLAAHFDVLIHAPLYAALRALAPDARRGSAVSSIGSAPANGAAARE